MSLAKHDAKIQIKSELTNIITKKVVSLRCKTMDRKTFESQKAFAGEKKPLGLLPILFSTSRLSTCILPGLCNSLFYRKERKYFLRASCTDSSRV